METEVLVFFVLVTAIVMSGLSYMVRVICKTYITHTKERTVQLPYEVQIAEARMRAAEYEALTYEDGPEEDDDDDDDDDDGDGGDDDIAAGMAGSLVGM